MTVSAPKYIMLFTLERFAKIFPVPAMRHSCCDENNRYDGPALPNPYKTRDYHGPPPAFQAQLGGPSGEDGLVATAKPGTEDSESEPSSFGDDLASTKGAPLSPDDRQLSPGDQPPTTGNYPSSPDPDPDDFSA